MPVPETGQNQSDAVSDNVSDAVPNWQPSSKQAAVLAEAGKGGVGRSITSVCDAANVSRDSFYRWMKKDEFRSAWLRLHLRI